MSSLVRHLLLCCSLLACGTTWAAARYLPVPGGEFRTALPTGTAPTVRVAPYKLRTLPVTNREFARFLRTHPAWRRGTAPTLFADVRYLADWRTADDYAPLDPEAPVTQVSWYAAQAYCESEGARLPSWHEWEFAAAADATRRDARGDAAWREQILGWYARPTEQSLPAVGRQRANLYGIHDLHALVWEWVADYNGLFVTVDSRSQGEQKLLETCGAAALSLGDRDNYAILMRIAMLSAVEGKDSLSSMGFRCARNR